MPLALHDYDADFAVWCSYKYLNAGPGAIGGCFVHERSTGDATPATCTLMGWWGHEEPTRFRMEPQFRAAAGAAAWQISNPPILSAAPLIASLAIFQEAAHRAAARQVRALTGFLGALIERLEPRRRSSSRRASAEPAAASSRSASPARRARGRRVFERLGERGVVCDWREPDVIRVAPVPLYNTLRGRVPLQRASRATCCGDDVSSDAVGDQPSTSSAPASPARCSRVLLARRGFESPLYDRRPDPRQHASRRRPLHQSRAGSARHPRRSSAPASWIASARC